MRIGAALLLLALAAGAEDMVVRVTFGDEPFAVLLPDELMGDSSLLAQMNGVCASTGGSVVGVKQAPRDQLSAYGVLAPSGPTSDEGVIPVADLVEKPPVEEAPSDYILIGRYVLTADVFDEIEKLAKKPTYTLAVQFVDLYFNTGITSGANHLCKHSMICKPNRCKECGHAASNTAIVRIINQ